ncbi:MAG: hypothetical protein ACI9KK_001225 [Ascidiaceihabitans sp.]|jgi:hypothetical protein
MGQTLFTFGPSVFYEAILKLLQLLSIGYALVQNISDRVDPFTRKNGRLKFRHLAWPDVVI